MSELKQKYNHVIVGGGIAADKAARAIHSDAPEASIVIITESEVGPFYLPSLTKDLWLDSSATVEEQELGTAEIADVVTSTTVTAIDPEQHTVTTQAGDTVAYDKLLLATGATARPFPGSESNPHTFTIRSAADYKALRAAVSEGTTVGVIGGGYISTEIAAGLSAANADVTIYFDGDVFLEHMFPKSITSHLTTVYKDKGIKLESGKFLDKLDTQDEKPTAIFQDGTSVTVDVLVLGLGAELNTELAKEAGLELVDGAVKVDETLGTSAEDVYAAGDIAHFNDGLLGRRHVEHVAQAEGSGEAAGHNMVGNRTEYTDTPLFFSDLFDDGYEAVGVLSTKLDTKEVWNDDKSAAVVYYLDGDKVHGVLLWNTWDSVPDALKVLEASLKGEVKPEDLDSQITPGD